MLRHFRDFSIADGASGARPDGERWRNLPNVEDWRGHGGDPSDTGALQAAVDEAVGVIQINSGILGLENTVTIGRGVGLVGPGWGDATNQSSGPANPLASISWTGSASTAPMLLVKAPTSGHHVYNFFIDRVILKGLNAGGIGLKLSSTRHCRIGFLRVERFTVDHVKIDDGNAALSVGPTIDHLIFHAGTNGATLNSNGFVAKSAAVGNSGLTQLIAGRIEGAVQDGDGVVLGDLDASVIQSVQASSTGSGYGLRFLGAGDVDQTRSSRKIFVGYFAGRQVRAEAGSRNRIGEINSEGTSVSIAAGAVLKYNVIDRNDGRTWASFNYDVDMHLDCPISDGYGVTGSPALTTYGSFAGRGVAFDAAAVERWMWLVPALRRVSGGRVTGVKGWGYHVAAAGGGAGDVVLELGGQARGDAAGFGGSITTKTGTLSIPDTGGMAQFSILFDTPLDLPKDSHFILRLARLGTDVADTYAADWVLMSLCLLYEADVADSDSDGEYRYNASPDFI